MIWGQKISSKARDSNICLTRCFLQEQLNDYKSIISVRKLPHKNLYTIDLTVLHVKLKCLSKVLNRFIKHLQANIKSHIAFQHLAINFTYSQVLHDLLQNLTQKLKYKDIQLTSIESHIASSTYIYYQTNIKTHRTSQTYIYT